MVEFTWDNKQKTTILGSKIARIRERISSDGPLGNTRIDWARTEYVTEQAKTVADAVKAELPSLRQLTLPGGKPIWFDAKSAAGPEYIIPGLRTGGVNSGFYLGGKLQLVADSPEDVAKCIGKEGIVFTIRNDGHSSLAINKAQTWSKIEFWDPESVTLVPDA